MVRNCFAFITGTSRIQFTDALGERLQVLGIQFLASFSCALTGKSTSLGIGETFLFRPSQRAFFHQYALPLISFARTTKADDHGPQRRIPAGSASERRITASEKNEVVEIGACQTQRPVRFHPKEAPFPELFAAVCTL